MPSVTRHSRGKLALPLALAALAAAPAAAPAATVTVSGSSLTFNAGSGEPNALRITKASGSFRVVDTGASAVTANAGCTQVSPRIATCPVGSVTVVNAYLWDQDDTAVFTGDSTARLFGYNGTDDLTGGSGNDTLDTGTGIRERLNGRTGNDVLTASASTGTAYLTGADGNDTLTGPRNAGVPSGVLGVYQGGTGNDKIVGSAADDALIGGTGADTIDGQGGFDVAGYADRSEPLNVNPLDGVANDGGASDGPAGARDKVASNVEGSVGGSGNDVLTGTSARDLLVGGAGSDTLNGGSSNDSICGDGVASVDPSGALFFGCFASASDGADTLNGAAGDDLLMGNLGADLLNGGTGFDVATWAERSSGVTATIDDCPAGAPCALANDGQRDVNDVTAGNQPEGDKVALDVEALGGGSGADSLTGSDAANRLSGYLGDDMLIGLDGEDALCGDRPENLTFGSFLATAAEACQAQATPGFASADTLDGGAGDDLLNGNIGTDLLSGGSGRDTVSYSERTPGAGGAGVTATIDDTCAPPTPSPCALANDGVADQDPTTPGDQREDDTIARDVENLVGTGGNDTLGGSATVNVITAGAGTDTLNGLAAGDVLEPGAGDGDVVNGGGGTDYASYRPLPGACAFCGGSGVVVTLDGVANDGLNVDLESEGDNIKTDVEGVLGSDQDDLIIGQSGSVANILMGYGGSDQIAGNAGNDSISGGTGTDFLGGGSGDDVVDSADGEPDDSDCGDGTGDRAVFDSGIDTPVNCETLDGEAVFAGAVAAKRLVAGQHARMEAAR